MALQSFLGKRKLEYPSCGQQEPQKRLGQVRVLKIKQDYFQPYKSLMQMRKKQRDRDREKSSSFAFPRSQGSLVGFSHGSPTPFCTPEVISLAFTKVHCGFGIFLSNSQPETGSVTKPLG